MVEVIIVGIFLWVIIGSVIECLLADSLGFDCIETPKCLYDNTKMNWFGSIFCYILIRLISPAITILLVLFLIIICLCSAVHWLFTVGRDDGSEEE